jgi:hypothetical protein
MKHTSLHTNSWLIGSNGCSQATSLVYCFSSINIAQDKPRLKPGWNDADGR